MSPFQRPCHEAWNAHLTCKIQLWAFDLPINVCNAALFALSKVLSMQLGKKLAIETHSVIKGAVLLK